MNLKPKTIAKRKQQLDSELLFSRLETDKPKPPVPVKHKYKKLTTKDSKRRADQLKPYHWKPGQSGNPTGMNGKDVSLVMILKKHLSERPQYAEA